MILYLSLIDHRPNWLPSRLTHDEYNELRESASSIPLRNPYKVKRDWFYLLIIAGIFTRSAVIGLAQRSGWAQTVLLLVVEIIILIMMAVFMPYNRNGANVTVQVFRVIVSGLLISFNTTIPLSDIPR